MNNKIYRLARYYIKRCNNKWKNNQYPNKEILKSLTRLTYLAFDKYLLLYGCDAEWQIFNKYDVLDNAIQRLAEYENIGTVEEFKTLKKESLKYEVKYEDEMNLYIEDEEGQSNVKMSKRSWDILMAAIGFVRDLKEINGDLDD